MKQKEITILTDDELNDKLGAFQKNLHDMKLTHAVSPLVGLSLVSSKKKNNKQRRR